MTSRSVIGIVLAGTLLILPNAAGAAWDAGTEDGLNTLVAKEAYVEALKRLQSLPPADDDAAIAWIAGQADAGRLIAPFLIERSKRAFHHDPKEGLKWFYAGLLWGSYDGRRCRDKTAAQAILVFQTLVPDVVARQKDYPWEASAAAVDAMSWEESHPALALPWWICAHGIQSALGVDKANPATWLKPEQEWPALRIEARQWLRTVIAALDKLARQLEHRKEIDPATLAGRAASGKMRTDGGYAMWDSGLMGHSLAEPHWIDDDQLIIEAFDGPVPRTLLDYRRLKRGEYSSLSLEELKQRRAAEPDLKLFEYYVWRHGQQPEQISDDRWIGALIQGNEIEAYFRCSIKTPNCDRQAPHVRGRPGAFKEFLPISPRKREGYHPTTYHTTHFDFHTVLDPAMRGLEWTLLKKGHGRIVWSSGGMKNRYEHAEFFPEGAKQPIKLPFGIRDVGLPLWGRWVEFKGAYLFGIGLVSDEHFNTKWRERNCRTVWWMWPEGRAKSECIPAGPWVQLGGIYIFPSAKGWVLFARRPESERSKPGAGDKPDAIYLIGSGSYQTVLVAALGNGDISPNGCRLAFLYAPFGAIGIPPRLNRRETFRIIDFCDMEKRDG